MVDSEIDRQDLSVISSSNTQAEENNPSTIPQLPIEVLHNIWRYLSLKERVKVQRVSTSWRDHSRTTKSLWKDLHLFRDVDFNQADICKDVEILSQISKWTEIPTLAVFLQLTTKEHIAASKKIIGLLPSIKVQHLVIKFVSREFSYLPSWQPREEYGIHNFESIPGLYCLPEEAIQVFKSNISLSTGQQGSTNHFSALYEAITKAGIDQDKALFNAISTCSNLRSLILDVQSDVLTHFSQDMPVARCKLDILSIRCFPTSFETSLKDQHRKTIYNMVKEARVIELVKRFSMESYDELGDLLSKASSSLEYLAIRSVDQGAKRTYEGAIINLPNLTHFQFYGFFNSPFKIYCPNLDSLMITNINDIERLENNPSIGSLLIGEGELIMTMEARKSAWDRLIKIGANRLHTLYLYVHCISEENFLKIFLQANIFPHLRKIIVLASGQSSASLRRVSLNSFNKLSREQLLNVRKIDTLIWQCVYLNDVPTLYIKELIGKHFATNCEFIGRNHNRSFNDLQYSTEFMGNFVKFKSVSDKAEYFQEFLRRSSKAKASGSAQSV